MKNAPFLCLFLVITIVAASRHGHARTRTHAHTHTHRIPRAGGRAPPPAAGGTMDEASKRGPLVLDAGDADGPPHTAHRRLVVPRAASALAVVHMLHLRGKINKQK